MKTLPRERFASAITAYNTDHDALHLFTALIDAIRPARAEDSESAIARHAALIDLLEQDPASAALLRQAFAELIGSRRMVSFLADSGILPPTGFFSEFVRIISHRVLPEIPDPREFRECVHIMLHQQDDWLWLSEIPFANSLRLWHVLAPDDFLGHAQIERLFDQFLEAILVLAYRISGLDIDQEFRRLGDSLSGYSAAFRAVAGEAQHVADAWRAAVRSGDTPPLDERHLLVLIDQCLEVVAKAHHMAMRVGTSLALTFSLRRAKQSLRRLEALATLLGAHWQGDARDGTVRSWALLIRHALRAENQRNSLRKHIGRGIGLLALRVTDNAAKSGEHYVTETRGAYWGMWRSAMGAGAIIAVLALLKIFTSKLDLAPIGFAFLCSMIYGLGFALIYMLHLTIATKQPAMTAQTLAGYLGEAERGRQEELERLVDLIAAVTRSQIAAIIGNVAVALPMAILVGVAWGSLTGAPMIDLGKGARLIADLNILGWALPHAAIAGVFLFFSGIISGYFDNLASYTRIGERIAHLRWLNALFSSERCRRLGDYVEGNLGGLSGNFLFGCMLGSASTIGLILGLPIDIRHIAFSSANFGYALTAFGFDLPLATILWALLGVGLIGLVNLSVSFSLALWMALRARDLAFTQTRGLLGTLWRRLVTAPRSFIAAPSAKPDPDGAAVGGT